MFVKLSNNHRGRTAMGAAAALISFVIIYLAGSISDATERYQLAEAAAKSRAHTTIGREGYEYIFEPNTQTLLDKILPNRARLIAAIVLEDYLPGGKDAGCWFFEGSACDWLQINILYGHDPAPVVRNLVRIASISAFLVGAWVFITYKPITAG